jgi:hypothetical protein
MPTFSRTWGETMKKTLCLVIASVLLTGGIVAPANALVLGATSFEKDPKRAAIYNLGACQTDTELDCIASFGVLDNQTGQEVFVPGNQISYDATLSSKNQNGNMVLGSESIWQVGTSSERLTYSLSAFLESPKHIWSSKPESRAGAFRVFVAGNEDDFITKVKMQIRTSWLRPLNLAMYASDADWSQEKIAGGNLWTFSGVRAKNSSYLGDWPKKLKENAPADVDGTTLVFLVDHAGKPGESYYDPSCSDKGFTAEASNATSAGQPYWNSQTRSLEFSIFAPHTDTKGNLNRGFFKLWVSAEYMKCKWPESGLDKAPSFTVSVVNSDGTKQNATKVVSFRKGQLFVAAYNFHYSAPTIRVKAGKSVKVSKKSTLICEKVGEPSVTKKLKGKSSVCPGGYQKQARP